MKILVTGVTGFVGGAVARKFVDKGHEVIGLMRNDQHVAKVKSFGITPLIGSHSDEKLLAETVRAVDAVVNCADSDDAYFVASVIPHLHGTGKTFIQTSGSSIVADRAAGEFSPFKYHEGLPVVPVLEKTHRVEIDKYVIASALHGVRSIVICPCLIYGKSNGVKTGSFQIPMLIDIAKQKGKAVHVGKGLNVWSNVHIDDLTDLYVLALEKAAAGSFFFAENGEASMKQAVESISRLLGFGGTTEELPIDQAVTELSPVHAYFTFGSNSRINADKARKMLGWSPSQKSLIEDIEKGSYAEQHLVHA